MKVGIQVKEGRLILVWNDGKRRTMAIGLPDSTVGRALAQKTAAQIELDFRLGDEHYDRTLLKYKPRTLGKTATEISAPELFDRFTKQHAKAKGLTQSSIDTRYIPLRKMLEKVLNVPANTIDRRAAEKFADACATTLQPQTSKERIWLLASCWDWAVSDYHVTKPKFRGLSDRFRKTEPKKRPQPFDAGEVRAILDGFRSSQYYSSYADFVAFLLGVGCRFGEAVGLTWGNVAADCSTVYICQSITRGVVGNTKTKRSRTVNLPPSIAAMLERRKTDKQPNPSDLVFSEVMGRRNGERVSIAIDSKGKASLVEHASTQNERARVELTAEPAPETTRSAEIADYIQRLGKLYNHCLTTAANLPSPIELEPAQIKDISTTIFIQTVRHFDL
jgi:integrase